LGLVLPQVPEEPLLLGVVFPHALLQAALNDLDGMGGAVSAVGPNGSSYIFRFESRVKMPKMEKLILCEALKDHPEKLVKPRRNVVSDTLSAYLRVSV
jgi:hypothetical protein